MKPDVLICDESVSALDVSVQAQVLNLLLDLQDEFGLAYLFISHDLAVVRYISDDVMVMNRGEVVEIADSDTIYRSPQNPYTQRLLASIPRGYVRSGRGRLSVGRAGLERVQPREHDRSNAPVVQQRHVPAAADRDDLGAVERAGRLRIDDVVVLAEDRRVGGSRQSSIADRLHSPRAPANHGLSTRICRTLGARPKRGAATSRRAACRA